MFIGWVLTFVCLKVWKFVVTSNEDRLITGSVDSELRVWEIKFLNSEVRTCCWFSLWILFVI